MTNKSLLVKSSLRKEGVTILKIEDSQIRGKYILLLDSIKNESEVVVFKNEKGFFIFTVSEWMIFFKEIKENYRGEKRRAVERSFSKRSKKVKIKKDGTVLVPANLRKK